MRKRKPVPDIITLANHLNPNWTHRVNLSEDDAWKLAGGVVPDWLQAVAQFWERDNPKPSDVPKLEPLQSADAVARDVA